MGKRPHFRNVWPWPGKHYFNTSSRLHHNYPLIN
ncbi:hypothetical protein BVRB_6g141640 [Beta vulgaris subsp. vulgaris]|nr:hypothetical protein BVRB_6g141640 [Beta vulgaris subsp. vulgaris]